MMRPSIHPMPPCVTCGTNDDVSCGGRWADGLSWWSCACGNQWETREPAPARHSPTPDASGDSGAVQ